MMRRTNNEKVTGMSPHSASPRSGSRAASSNANPPRSKSPRSGSQQRSQQGSRAASSNAYPPRHYVPLNKSGPDRLGSDAQARDVDALRAALQHERNVIHELRAALEKQAITTQQNRRASREAELAIARAMREAELRVARADAFAVRAASDRDIAREEMLEMKKRLEEEKQAQVVLLREHTAELKGLREQLMAQKHEAYRDLHDRSAREEQQLREVRDQAEATFNTLEEDFKAVLAHKDHQIRALKAEMRDRQKEAEDQVRTAVRVGLARTQMPPEAATDVAQLKADLRAADRKCQRLVKQLQETNERMSAVRPSSQRSSAVVPTPRKRATSAGDAPPSHNDLPKKRCKSNAEAESADTTPHHQHTRLHVKDIVRQLQAQADSSSSSEEHGCTRRSPTNTATSRTMDDLDAIDQDLEKLRQQLRDRDRVIHMLRHPSPPPVCTCGLARDLQLSREREAELEVEAASLREQNDLMEFRILELEECYSNEGLQGSWSPRDGSGSDSGVMSLPSLTSGTSEDPPTPPPDTHLHPYLQNVCRESKLTGVATVFPSRLLECRTPSPDTAVDKPAARGEALQESGIFEEDLVLSRGAAEDKAVQTEPLSAAIRPHQKLCRYPGQVCEQTSFYEERLSQLQRRLEVYESEGGAREKLLRRRLERETSLEAQVRTLSDRLTGVMDQKLALEEEKCEFEEAENDSRLQCQRLELQLMELSAVKAQLEAELQHVQAASLDTKRRRKRADVTQLQQTVVHLTEKAQQDATRLSELEALVEEKEDRMAALLELKLTDSVSAADVHSLSHHLGLNPHDPTAPFKERIESLEKMNEAIISALSQADQVWAGHEEDYKSRISSMEVQHEERLQQAKQVWAGHEEAYKSRIAAMEVQHEKRLEQAQQEQKSQQEQLHHLTQHLQQLTARLARLADLEVSNSALKTQLEMVLDEATACKNQVKLLEAEKQMARETLDRLTSELERERECDLRAKVAQLAAELAQKDKEISDLEVTTSELREEVDTLERNVGVCGRIHPTLV